MEFQFGIERIPYIPKNVTLELTRNCALNCLICSSNGGLPHPSELTFLKWLEIIDQLIDLGAESFSLSGGEPFCCSYFKDICKYLSDSNVYFSIYTSGNVIQNDGLQSLALQDIEFISKLNLKNIIFSLEGSNEKTHEKITNVIGSFKNTLSSIKLAVNQNIKTELHFVPTLLNYKELLGVISIARDLGVSKVSVLRFVPQGRGEVNSLQLMLKEEEIRELRKILQKCVYVDNFVRLGHPLNPFLLSDESRCSAGRDRITIRYDGLAFPCEAMKFLENKFYDNDIKQCTIKEIWNESKLFSLARNFYRNVSLECIECEFMVQCGGGCPAQRLKDGSVSGMDSYCGIKNECFNILEISQH